MSGSGITGRLPGELDLRLLLSIDLIAVVDDEEASGVGSLLLW